MTTALRFAAVISTVMLLSAPATAKVTAYATWNTQTGYIQADTGWAAGYMSDPGNRVCGDSNPWYTGPSPGSGYVCYWIRPDATIHANMQWPSIAATGGRFGGGLDTSIQSGWAAMVYLMANASLQELVGDTWVVRGVVRQLNNAEGCVEFFFKPNWDPASDSKGHALIHISDNGWTFRRTSSGMLWSVVKNAYGASIGHPVAGQLVAGWNHIALAWDANSVRTYVNGAKSGETVYGSGYKVSWRMDQYIFIGGGNNGLGETAEEMQAADGMYDNLIVHDDAHYTGDSIAVPGEVPPPAPMTIVDNGAPNATIVVSSVAPGVVQEAVVDLQAYIQKMSGALLPISNSPDTPGNLILVGRMPEVDMLVPDLDQQDLGPDGYVHKGLLGRLVLTGQSDGSWRPDYGHWNVDCGTPNAVYAFLENLGCRWYMPGEDGEVIPTMTTITVAALDVADKPDFPGRWIGEGAPLAMGGTIYDEYTVWLRRNRKSANTYHQQHNFEFLVPTSEYFATHPEYYSLIDGRRYGGPSPQTQLCTSNSSVMDISSQFVAGEVYYYDSWRSFPVCPNDSWLWCECGPCQALDGDQTFTYGPAEGAVMGMGPGTWRNVSHRYLLFVNEVSDQVIAKLASWGHTGTPPLIMYYAFYNLPGFPEVPPRDNVMPCVAHLAPDNPYWGPTAANWAAVSQQLYYYTYMGYRTAYPKLAISDDINWCRQHKGLAMYLEVDEYSPINSLPLYLATKALWDTDADIQSELDSFYSGFYGPAESNMRAFWETFQAATADASRNYDCHSSYPGSFTSAVASQCRAYLTTAYSQVSDPVMQRRILDISQYWTEVEKEVAARDAMDTWRQNRTTANKNAAATLINNTISYINSVAGDYYLECRKAYLNAWLNELTSTGVVGRYVFYNNSAWDGNDPGAGASDDGAVAPDKLPLKDLEPAELTGFLNYTSYSRGINGIMVDIANMPGTPTAADFYFRVGNVDNVGQWAIGPPPASVTVRRGAGAGGSDRVTIIWADNAIENQWLRVVVSATAATGLPSANIFYFGNAIGETGDGSGVTTRVNATDEVAIRNNPRTLADPAAIDDPFDVNRDRKVDATDQIISRNHPTNFVTELRLIQP